MKRRGRWLVVGLALSVLAGMAGARTPEWYWRLPAGVAPPEVPADNPLTPARVALGRRLFYDADLSINGTLSCATCHEQRHSFSDGVQAHPGAHGEPGLRNVPSLLNVAWSRPLTWAHPAMNALEDQALVPIMGDDPVEMGMKGKESDLVRRLSANSCYRALFRKAFPGERGQIGMGSMLKAIASFERTIVSYETAWDHARSGGPALPATAVEGERLFRGSAGCASCHSGVNFTDLQLHPFAFAGRDAGASRATGKADDRGRFRTPGLRNVAITAPYLHDGSAADLHTAIARHAINLSPDEEAAILSFLDQLTDHAITRDPRLSLPTGKCG